MSHASQPFREAFETERNSISTSNAKASDDTTEPFGDPAEEDAEDRDVLPSADPTQPGDLPLPPALLAAFQQSLSDYGIELRFFSGSWQSFDLAAASTTGKYDTVITSETIYRTDSLGALLDLMWRACTGREDVEQPLEQLTDEKLNIGIKDQKSPSSYLCLVAAKKVYFGVGGGVAEFIQAVETGLPTTRARPKGRAETIWRLDEGVKRSVMRVEWQRAKMRRRLIIGIVAE
ncbi:hypothetical protein EIP86_007314 [Pleurotus ostreatoroseus]|nr:hypothetical protein EIP86_007314 [Pleurotus ostreatoroseus]